MPAPENLSATAGEWLITVGWNPLSDPAFSYYKLYRNIDGGAYSVLASGLTSLLYLDRNVDPSHTYGYKVSAVDVLGREGPSSAAVETRPLQQTTSPRQTSLQPATGSRFKGTLELVAEAEDEIGIVAFRFQYSASDWTTIGEDTAPTKVGAKTWRGRFTWDASALDSGNYQVRVIAVNRGNLTDSATNTYVLDRTAPAAPASVSVTDPRTGGALRVSWAASSEPDLAGYYVYRSQTSGGGYSKVSSLVTATFFNDTGLTNGTRYYYVVTAVDTAQNESSFSAEASSTPGAECDLKVDSLGAIPASPPVNQAATLKAVIENIGPAAAAATVTFYHVQAGGSRTTLGSASVNVPGGGGKADATVSWTPAQSGYQTISVEITNITPTDTGADNNQRVAQIRVNLPPVAPALQSQTVGWGTNITFDASAATDPDGTVAGYSWEFGDSSTSDKALTTHQYPSVGTFSVRLTVTDNDGATAQSSCQITVQETRPDLYVSNITWTPTDPHEGDQVTITATIVNQGQGATTVGFFVTYYIDGLYAGYQRFSDLLAVGQSRQVSFNWTAVKGLHVGKVKADDIQNNINEINENNNEASAALTSQQIFFPDLSVTELTYSPTTTTISSQESIVVEATVGNSGTAAAEGFWVSLFFDGAFHSKKQVASLAPGGTTRLIYKIDPIPGSHQVTVMADDMVGTVLESDESNNVRSVDLPAYTLNYPDFTVKNISWQPQDSTLSDGSSLTILATIGNEGAAEVKRSFSVSFYVDDKFVANREATQLAAGGESSFSVKWRAKPGEHKIKVVVDEANSIVETDESNNTGQATTPSIEIIYPELSISDVAWIPLNIKYGQTVNFRVRVTNASVVSTLSTFFVTMYIDGNYQKRQEVPLVGGHATLLVPLDWNADILGEHEVKFVADDGNSIIEQDETNNTAVRTLNIGDSLKVKVAADGQDPTQAIGEPIIYGSRDTIHLTAEVSRASAPQTLLDPDDGISTLVTIRHSGGNVVTEETPMDFDAETGRFGIAVSLVNYWTGTYQVYIAATDGVESKEFNFSIIVYEEVTFTLTTDKQIYQRGERAHITGTVTYLSGAPVANKQVFLVVGKGRFDDQDMTFYITRELVGAEGVQMRMELSMTDDHGNIDYEWQPMWGDIGYFTVNAFVISKRVLGNFGKAEFNILGLDASPMRLTVATAKSSQLFKSVTLTNVGDETLTGLEVGFIDENHTDKVRATVDTSGVPTTLPPGGKAVINLAFDIAEDAPDEVIYLVKAATAEGARAQSRVWLQLRPAVPAPRFSPAELTVGLNPGNTATRTVTVTNKGYGTMRNISIVPPAILPWVSTSNLNVSQLKPGESLTFDIIFSPSQDLPLGTYVDRVGVKDGATSYLPFTVQITSANRGTVSFIVTNDNGETVPGANIRLVSQTPYVAISASGEQTTYFERINITTNAQGVANLEDAPVGSYDYSITAPGHQKVTGTVAVQPLSQAAIIPVVLIAQPIQFRWTVTPTTITDEYEITLKLSFVAKIPVPKLAFVPPWVNVPHEVGADYTDYITVINPSLVELHDVKVEVVSVPGMSLTGGGIIGTLAPESTVTLAYRVRAGNYDFLDDSLSSNPNTYFQFTATFVDFDPETLVARDAELKPVKLPIVNPGKNIVKLELPSGEVREIAMPDTGDDDLKLPKLPDFKPQAGAGEQVFELVKLEIPQKASMEREAFDCNLELSNGHLRADMTGLNIQVRVEDAQNQDVTPRFYLVPPELAGIGAIDGSDTLRALSTMTAYWQLIPGEGLGGTQPEGKKYYVKAVMSYFVNGRLVQTETQAVEITVHPQPQLYLHYYIPQLVYAYEPFKLGIEVENKGDGPAKNLRIESGQPKIVENRAGLLIKFEIIETSFGFSQGKTFTLVLGDVPPHSKVNGYWLMTTTVDGRFTDFTAELTHKAYKGIQLNPLILGVDTRIIEKDGVVPEAGEPENVCSLIDQDKDGFPDYLINLGTGLHLPVTVPSNVTVTKPPTAEDKTMRLQVPATQGYIVVMQPDQLPDSNVSAVTREAAGGQPAVQLSLNNIWKNGGNLYFVDQNGGSYLVDYRSGLRVEVVEYTPEAVFQVTPEGYNPIFFDTGIRPNVGDTTYLRAKIFNRGVAKETAAINFYDDDPVQGRKLIRSEQVSVSPFRYSGTRTDAGFLFGPIVEWSPANPGNHIIVVQAQTDAAAREKSLSVVVNAPPIVAAGSDFTTTVGKSTKFDGSRSRDTDGYIRSFMWDFGDDIWGSGVDPTHTYKRSGTYQVTLHVTDDNGAESTDTLQLTVQETREDLIVESISLNPPSPQEGDSVNIQATIKNQGVRTITAKFMVGFYVDGVYMGYKEISGLDVQATSMVSFPWVVTAGNHMFTAIADDVGNNVDESDESNNQRSLPLHAQQVFFPDLQVTNISWSEASGSVGWAVPTTFTATVANTGTGDAGAFRTTFYVDGKYLGFAVLEGLSHNQGQNTAQVTCSWIPSPGAHKVTVKADAPITHVVELDETNNSASLDLLTITLVYPNLAVSSLSYLPENNLVNDGDPLHISAVVANTSQANLVRPFEVAFYVDGALAGTRNLASLEAGKETRVNMDWRATPGIHELKVAVDGKNAISETDKTDNAALLTTGEVNILLPDLVIGELRWSPQKPAYGESITYFVKAVNIGHAPTSGPFAICLGIGDQTITMITHRETVMPGASVSFSDSKPALLPTVSGYVLKAVADFYDELSELSEDNNEKSVTITVAEGLLLTPQSDKETYVLGESPKLSLKVASSNTPDTLLGSGDGIAASVQIVDKDNNQIAQAAMTYDAASKAWGYAIGAQLLQTGFYTARFQAQRGATISTRDLQFLVIKDFRLTVTANKPSYLRGEEIAISGTLKTSDSAAIANTEVLLAVNNGVDRQFKVKTDQNGAFSQSYKPAAGEGGDFTVEASATISGVTRSATTSFGVQGLLLTPSPFRLEVLEGSQGEAEFVLTNVGSAAISGLSVALTNPAQGQGISASLDTVAMATSLAAGARTTFKVLVSVAGTPSQVDISVDVTSAQGYTAVSRVDLSVKPLVAVYRLSTSSISVSMRPGDLRVEPVYITNQGTGKMLDVQASPPSRLPWVSLVAAGLDEILPWKPGMISTDPKARGSINVHIAPPASLPMGVYKDVMRLQSNAGEATIQLSIEISTNNVGSLSILVVNSYGTPLPGAAVTLVYQGGAGETSLTYSSATDETGTVTHLNIPSGRYSLSIEARHHQPFQGTLEVGTGAEIVTAKFTLNIMPLEFKWDMSSVKERVKFKETLGPMTSTDPDENPSLAIDYLEQTPEPRLQLDKPGNELWLSEILVRAGGKVVVRNPGTGAAIENLTAVVETDSGPLRLEEVISFGREIGAGNTLELGTLEPQSTLSFFYRVDTSMLTYGAPQVADGRIRIRGAYVVEGVVFGVEAIYLLRLVVYDSSQASAIWEHPKVKVAAAFGGDGVLYSESFLEKLNQATNGKIGGVPEGSGSSFSSMGLSQEASYEQESVNVSFSFFNPLPAPMENFYVEVIVTDTPLNADGSLPEGGQYLTDKFDISLIKASLAASPQVSLFVTDRGQPTTSFSADRIAPQAQVDIAFDVRPQSGVATETALDYFVQFIYDYLANGEPEVGVTPPKEGKVVPPPKVFLSYNMPTILQPTTSFDMEIVASNVGAGAAQNLDVKVPQLNLSGGARIKDVLLVADEHGSLATPRAVPGIQFGSLASRGKDGDTKSATLRIITDKPTVPRLGALPTMALTGVNPDAQLPPFGVQTRSTSLQPLKDEVLGLKEEMKKFVDNSAKWTADMAVTAAYNAWTLNKLERVSALLDAVDLLLNAAGMVQGAWHMYSGWKEATKNATVVRQAVTQSAEAEVNIVRRLEATAQDTYTSLRNVEIPTYERNITQINKKLDTAVKQLEKWSKQADQYGTWARQPNLSPNQYANFSQKATTFRNLQNQASEQAKALTRASYLAEEQLGNLNRQLRQAELTVQGWSRDIAKAELTLSRLRGAGPTPAIATWADWGSLTVAAANTYMALGGAKEGLDFVKTVLTDTGILAQQGMTEAAIQAQVLRNIKERPVFMPSESKLGEVMRQVEFSNEEQFAQNLKSAIEEKWLKAESVDKAWALTEANLNWIVNLIDDYLDRSVGHDEPAFYPTLALTKYVADLRARIKQAGRTQGPLSPLVWHTFDAPSEPIGQFGEPLVETTMAERLHTVSQAMGQSPRTARLLLQAVQSQTEVISERDTLMDMKRAIAAWDAASLFMGALGGPLGGAWTGMTMGAGSLILGYYAGQVETAVQQMEKQSQQQIADLLVRLSRWYPSEVGLTWRISSDLKDVFKYIDQFQLIDPDLSVDVLSVQTPDIALQPDKLVGEEIGKITVKNTSQNEIEVSASMSVFGVGEEIGGGVSNSVTVAPGATALLEVPYRAMSSWIASRSGYDAVILLDASDPSSGTVSQQFGPWYSHFYAGTAQELAAYHQQPESRPLGGTINPGESQEASIQAGDGTHTLRLVLTKPDALDIQLHLYDAQGNHVGLDAQGQFETNIANATASDPENVPFVIEVRQAAGKQFRAVVENKDAALSGLYSLYVLEIPASAPQLRLASDNVYRLTNSRTISYKLQVKETSEVADVTGLVMTVTDLNDGAGHVIPAAATHFTLSTTTLHAGMWAEVSVELTIPAGSPDGTYAGTLTIAGRDAANNPVSGTAQLTVAFDTTPPSAPVLNQLSSPIQTPTVTVTGTGTPKTLIHLYLDEALVSGALPQDNGSFSAEVSGLGAGNHRIAAKAEDAAGNLSASSNEIVLVSQADITPPATSLAVTQITEGSVTRFRVTLSAQDNPGGVGVKETLYALNEGTEWHTYSEPFLVEEAGTTLWYRSIDLANNAEPLNTHVIKLEIHLHHIVISPEEASLAVGQQQQFTATGYDENNNEIHGVVFQWSVVNATAGSVDANGLFTAGNTVGTYADCIQAAAGGATGSASVTVRPLPILSFNLDGNNVSVSDVLPGVAVNATLKSPDGVVKAAATGTPQNDTVTLSFFKHPFGMVLINTGDKLEVTQGTVTVVVKAVSLTAEVDIFNDLVFGTAPGGSNIKVSLTPVPGGETFERTPTADASGHYSANFSGVVDIKAGNPGSVVYTYPQGHQEFLIFQAPKLWVTENTNMVSGTASSGDRVEILLEDSSQAVKARSQATAPQWGNFSAEFTDAQGQPVIILGGDTVEVWVEGRMINRLPVDAITALVNEAANTVSGTAPAGASLRVTLFIDPEPTGQSYSGQRDVTADGNGNYVADFSGVADIKGGDDKGTVTYVNPDGNEISLGFHARSVFVLENTNFVRGWVAPNQQVALTLLGGLDTAKSQVTVNADLTGEFRAFFPDAIIEAGDTVQVTPQGNAAISVPVVALGGVMNKDEDKVEVTGPPNNRLLLQMLQERWDFPWPSSFSSTFYTDSSGRYTVDAHWAMDITNGVYGWISYTNSDKNKIYIQIHVPLVAVEQGSEVWGVAGAGARVDLVLKSGNSVKATATVHADAWDGKFKTGFVSGGSPVAIEPGDTVEAALAGDASFVIPVVPITVVTDEREDTVSGTGPANSSLLVQLWAQREWWNEPWGIYKEIRVDTNASGNFVADFSDQLDIVGGDHGFVRYYNADGNQVYRAYEFPPSSNIRGKVLLQGRSNHSGALIAAGGIEVSSGEDGSFVLGPLPVGEYTIVASRDGYLRAQRMVQVEEGKVAGLPAVTLLGGDADGNQVIDILDLVTMVASFNQAVPANSASDINGNGKLDIFDLTLVGMNFGETGSPWQNNPPVAVNDAYSTGEDTVLNAAVGVLDNDSDVDGDPLTATLASNPAHGVVVLSAGGSFVYTPAVNFNGRDSFTYKANDGEADSNVATVTITVNPVNDAPVAANDAYSTDEDTALNAAVGVLHNDTDVDGDPLTATLVSNPAHGTLTLSAGGPFVYTPAGNFHGTDSFTYKANDGVANSNVATVTITVNPVNDAPVADAGADQAVDEGGSVTLAGAGSDVDGGALTFSWTQTAGPTVVLSDSSALAPSFTAPQVGVNTVLTFELRVSDGTATASDTVNVTVRDVPPPETVVLQPSPGLNDGTDDGTATKGKDTWVWTNPAYYTPPDCPGDPALPLYNSPCNSNFARGYLQFSLDGLPRSNIASARIVAYTTVYFNGAGWPWYVDPQISLRRVTSGWSETTLNWANQPSYAPAVIDPHVIDTVGGGSWGHAYTEFEGWLTFDVTELYRGWASGSITNHGVAFFTDTEMCVNGDEILIFSSDNPDASLRPKLVVTYMP